MSGSTYYPVFLDLHGRPCVVLGDNPLADEKAEGLRAAGATVTHLHREFAPGDLDGAYLAVDASGHLAGQAGARREADREGILLNVVDVAAQCDWIAPAVVRRGPLQLAISTSGESPFLAATLRRRLEKDIGPEWAAFTALMGGLRRRLRHHGVTMERQQHAYRSLLHSDALRIIGDSPLQAEALAERVEVEARDPEAHPRGGEVTLVGAGPGDPGLITVAGREALISADVVLYDALVDVEILSHCPPSARLVNVGKRGGRPSTSQSEITEMLIAEARRGNTVVRLKGGDPFVFGRGGEEVAALAQAGVPVRVIPGVSALLAAPAAAGIPLTLRGVASSIAVVAGQRADPCDDALERLALSADTLVVLMPGDLDELTARLSTVLGGDRPAAAVSSATTSEQSTVCATLRDLAGAARASALEAPLTVIVGEVVDALPSRRTWSAPYVQEYGRVRARGSDQWPDGVSGPGQRPSRQHF